MINKKDLLKKLNKKIPDRWRGNPFCVDFCAALLSMLVKYDAAFGSELIQAVDHCFEDEGTDRRTVRKEMLREYVRNWMTPSEFYKYGLLKKSQEEKLSYYSAYNAFVYFKREDVNILPNDKYKRYEMFSKYFHREILEISQVEEASALIKYEEFVSRNPVFFVKSIRGAKGKGVIKCTAQETPDANVLISKMGGRFIVEGLINQGQELAVFHPESVNTVRFVTAMNPTKEPIKLFALLRVGRGGSIVDNVGSGGLVAQIDMESGIVCTDALCGMDYYEYHPDTHIRFKGTKMPEWEKLCNTACEMHRSQPDQRLFGFDFAWTDNGWDLVEVNPAPAFTSFQTLSKRGIRPVLIEKKVI